MCCFRIGTPRFFFLEISDENLHLYRGHRRGSGSRGHNFFFYNSCGGTCLNMLYRYDVYQRVWFLRHFYRYMIWYRGIYKDIFLTWKRFSVKLTDSSCATRIGELCGEGQGWGVVPLAFGFLDEKTRTSWASILFSLVAEVKVYTFVLFYNDNLFIHRHNTVAHLNPLKNCGAASVGSITRQFGFINLVDNVNWSPCKEIRKLMFGAFWWRANTQNVSFRISLRLPIYIIKPVDKTKLSCESF